MREGSGPGKVLDSFVVSTMTQMMEQTISSGTGRKAKINRPAAGKTGTSQSLRDAWFIGFTSDLVVGVWFGNDNDSPMNEITGGTAPAILWSDFMQKAHAGVPVKSLNYVSVKKKRKLRNNDKINKIISKSKRLNEQKSVFERILDNFF
jgi:penicillin-binding protein 1A